ncbi:EboA domain-containing protein [Streptomyces sp. ID05-04B]|uniref:EboA domain-containing protein n=1 Tax=unclassified Streptomyces TaxID=2593676 RepID=UPI000D1B4079|nr:MULTISPECIES: EboA domain-containing protein [unclassified Streptomyces]AVV46585.1 sugar phosphate isomerase [Streptomyces sp. P3]MDX5570633.1 EboA domain-containing protein [Streptomyces sp. ID05-04B]
MTRSAPWTRDTVTAALLADTARTWFDEALTDAARAAQAPPTTPSPYLAHTWELRFAAAGRHCGNDNADAVRTLLLIEARAGLETLTRLYRHGSAAERRPVLRALPALVAGPHAVHLVEDALRSNDTRLIAAAVGPYAAAHLDPHAWRHAVLKCLFTGVPLDAVAGLAHRAAGDDELARMLTDFAAERTAAGRDLPDDLGRLLTLTGEEPKEL